MNIYYKDGAPITPIRSLQITEVSQTIHERLDDGDDGCTISAEVLTDDVQFNLLFMYWIKACIDYIWYADHGKKPDCQEAPEEEQLHALRFFSEDAGETDCKKFLKKYRDTLTTPHYPNIGNQNRAEAICDEIDAKLHGTAPYLRLRTAAVCLLANCFPEELFIEQQGWPAIPGSAAAELQLEKELLPIGNDTEFILDIHADFQADAGLIPRTLRNQGETSCTFLVRWHEAVFPVRLLPCGILRAVFSDKNCTKLVSLKGCISCGDTKRAVIQRGTENGVRLFLLAPDAGNLWNFHRLVSFWMPVPPNGAAR